MNWSEVERDSIMAYVKSEFKLARIDEERNQGIFAVLWFCRLNFLKNIIDTEEPHQANNETVLLEERERGKIWAGAYLQNGIVRFKTYDLKRTEESYNKSGISFLLFKTILIKILDKYSNQR